jgi:hypothetical protein
VSLREFTGFNFNTPTGYEELEWSVNPRRLSFLYPRGLCQPAVRPAGRIAMKTPWYALRYAALAIVAFGLLQGFSHAQPFYNGVTVDFSAPNTVIVTWLEGGILESATAATGPWSPVLRATSPYTYNGGGDRFWRSRYDTTPSSVLPAGGWVTKTIPAGKFALLSNPLTNPVSDTLPIILRDVPSGTVVYTFSPATRTFKMATKRGNVWTGTAVNDVLAPGIGFFVRNAAPADMTISFGGAVPEGTFLVFFAAGFSLLGSIVPQAGKLQTDLMLPAADGDKAFLFDPSKQAYTIFTKRTGSTWTGGTGEPVLPIAEGFFYQAAAAKTWARTFYPYPKNSL